MLCIAWVMVQRADILLQVNSVVQNALKQTHTHTQCDGCSCVGFVLFGFDTKNIYLPFGHCINSSWKGTFWCHLLESNTQTFVDRFLDFGQIILWQTQMENSSLSILSYLLDWISGSSLTFIYFIFLLVIVQLFIYNKLIWDLILSTKWRTHFQNCKHIWRLKICHSNIQVTDM